MLAQTRFRPHDELHFHYVDILYNELSVEEHLQLITRVG